MAWRRRARPPFLPSVTSFSTIGRKSFAFGSVVTICSCLISAATMLPNMARRCSAVRLNLRWTFPWRTALSQSSVVILEALGQLVDILRRPAGHFHAEMQAHLRQHFLDLVERLA